MWVLKSAMSEIKIAEACIWKQICLAAHTICLLDPQLYLQLPPKRGLMHKQVFLKAYLNVQYLSFVTLVSYEAFWELCHFLFGRLLAETKTGLSLAFQTGTTGNVSLS